MTNERPVRGLSEYVRLGLVAARRKPLLVLGLWLFQFAIAFLTTIPLSSAVKSLAETGFSADMARRIDIQLLADIGAQLQSGFGLAFLLLLVAVPVTAVLRALATAGVINAVRDGGVRGFWDGVRDYGLRSVGVALPFLLITLFVQACVFLVISIGIGAAGEQGTVLLSLLVLPVAMGAVGAAADLMCDYSQIAVVSRNESITKAFGRGIGWPFKHPRAVLLYAAWLVPAIVLVLMPLLFENWIAAASIAGILSLTLAQQASFILRAAVTVAWYASEVEFFESQTWDESPLIAGADDWSMPDEAIGDVG